MGSLLSCEECPGAATGTVLNLSNALVLRVADGVEPKRKSGQLPLSLEDKDWINQIKCIDDSHSSAYGLTYADISSAITKVEGYIDQDLLHGYCSNEMLKNCLQNNSGCTLKCLKEVGDFIDCIDRVRYEKLKIAIDKRKEQALKNRRKTK